MVRFTETKAKMTLPLYSNMESKLIILRISVQLNSLVSSNKGDEGQ